MEKKQKKKKKGGSANYLGYKVGFRANPIHKKNNKIVEQPIVMGIIIDIGASFI